MNLNTKQIVFLAGIIDEMTKEALEDTSVRIGGRFSIELEWQEAGRGTARGQYILKGVTSETTR